MLDWNSREAPVLLSTEGAAEAALPKGGALLSDGGGGQQHQTFGGECKPRIAGRFDERPLRRRG